MSHTHTKRFLCDRLYGEDLGAGELYWRSSEQWAVGCISGSAGPVLRANGHP